MVVGKWNFKRNNYEPYDLPRGASLIGYDGQKIINCASCGKEIKAEERTKEINN